MAWRKKLFKNDLRKKKARRRGPTATSMASGRPGLKSVRWGARRVGRGRGRRTRADREARRELPRRRTRQSAVPESGRRTTATARRPENGRRGKRRSNDPCARPSAPTQAPPPENTKGRTTPGARKTHRVCGPCGASLSL